jgi:Ca2+-transporting ATPase
MRRVFSVKLSLLRRILALALQKFMRIDGTQRAAAFAYYAFFSLFPLLVLLVTIGSLFFDRVSATEWLIGYAERHVPLGPELRRRVFDTIAGVVEARGKVGAVAGIALVWGSLQFFKALVRATSRAWNTDMHNWWQMPLKSLALLGVLTSALLLGIAMPLMAKLAEAQLTDMHGLVSRVTSATIEITPTLVLFYGLALFYRLAPREQPRFSSVWPATLGVVVLLRVIETLFGLYLKNFGNFNAVYGTLAGVMALLMWIYLSATVVVFGACVGAAQAEVTREHSG